jgi:hypothetical protein
MEKLADQTPADGSGLPWIPRAEVGHSALNEPAPCAGCVNADNRTRIIRTYRVSDSLPFFSRLKAEAEESHDHLVNRP